jgi:hypothetical protein
VCRVDLVPSLGACVSARQAAELCGAFGVPTPDGCAARTPCEPGSARDVDHSLCLSRREVRALAVGQGILVADDEHLVCPGEGPLVVSGAELGAEQLGCLPATVCPLGTRRVAPSGACLPERACPPGSVLEATGSCARFVARGLTPDRPRIDVARWLRTVMGADEGAGAPPLCEALARSPGGLAVLSSGETRIEVTLEVPDNDVSQVIGTARPGAPGASGMAALVSEPPPTAELGRVVLPMIEALRSLGGTAEQASARVTVRCPRAAAPRPAVSP